MGKIVETRELYKNTLKEITKNEEEWLLFLKSAAWQFKYSFEDKILIYAQNPNATACAEMQEWNNKVHRWVNKDAKAIFVFSKDENSKFPFRLVFDKEDTHNYRNTEYKLWEVKPEYESSIIETLEVSFGDIDNKDNLAQAIKLATINMVEDNIQDYIFSIKKYKKGSSFENLSDEDIYAIMFSSIYSSVANMIMTRCGIDPNLYIDKSEYFFINKFDSDNVITILGTATSEIAETALREIAKTVQNLQNKEKNINHTFYKNKKEEYTKGEKNVEGGIEYANNRIRENRRLSDTKYSNGEREDTNREIRTSEIKLSKETKEGRIYNIEDEQRIEQTSNRDSRTSNENGKTDSREVGETRGNNRGTQSTRPNEMGRTDEQLQIDSRGTSDERTNLQLELIDELLTEEEQKQNIAEAENASVFSFTQEMIDNVLQEGSHIEDSKFRIYEQMSKSLSSEENAKFLKNEYGIGGRSADDKGISESHNSKGITLENKENSQVLRLNWIQVEKRIRELISCDRYLNNKEKDEYFDWLDANDRPTPDIDIQNQIQDEDYKLAKRLHNYILDYDIVSYHNNFPLDNTEEQNIELLQADIADELNIKDYIEFLKTALEDMEENDEQIDEVRSLIEELEKRLPYYEYDKGNIVYIGTKEYSIVEIDDEKVLVVDTSFPILVEEFDRKEFDRKIRENPANDKLRTGKRVQDIKEQNKGITDSTEQATKERDYYEGDIVYLESDQKFEINKIDNKNNKIELLDLKLSSFMPIFRTETIKDFEKLYYNNPLNKKTEDIQVETENIDTEKKQKQDDKLKANIKTKRRNRIEYYDIHPEIPLKDRNNYKITDDTLGEGTKKEKFKRNVEAIKILKKCEEENRYATLEEQEKLAMYVGWGGLSEAFDKRKDEWIEEYKELSSILTEKEYNEARESALTSFYTPPIVINAIYNALEKMGLERGNILEPSCRSR